MKVQYVEPRSNEWSGQGVPWVYDWDTDTLYYGANGSSHLALFDKAIGHDHYMLHSYDAAENLSAGLYYPGGGATLLGGKGSHMLYPVTEIPNVLGPEQVKHYLSSQKIAWSSEKIVVTKTLHFFTGSTEDEHYDIISRNNIDIDDIAAEGFTNVYLVDGKTGVFLYGADQEANQMWREILAHVCYQFDERYGYWVPYPGGDGYLYDAEENTKTATTWYHQPNYMGQPPNAHPWLWHKNYGVHVGPLGGTHASISLLDEDTPVQDGWVFGRYFPEGDYGTVYPYGNHSLSERSQAEKAVQDYFNSQRTAIKRDEITSLPTHNCVYHNGQVNAERYTGGSGHWNLAKGVGWTPYDPTTYKDAQMFWGGLYWPNGDIHTVYGPTGEEAPPEIQNIVRTHLGSAPRLATDPHPGRLARRPW